MDQIINTYIKCYLIGPIEQTKAGDSGTGWRDKLKPELESLINSDGNPLYVYDPCAEEANKIGFSPKEFHKKLKGWLASGNNDKIAEGSNLIWKGKSYLEEGKLIHILGDIDYVRTSKFLIMRMEEGDTPCGTYMEAGIALEHDIPIYVIQTMPREKYPISFVGAVFATNGKFFDNPTQLVEFLITEYKLKVKKNG